MTIPKTKVQDLPPDKTYDAWVTDIALRFYHERPKDKPFFLVSSWFGPHPPFLIPEPYYSMYDPADIPEPPNFKPQPNKPRANATSYYHQLWLDHGDNWEAWKKSVAVYWGYVTMMDDLVGRLLQALEEDGIIDETLVIFTSDHGEMLGSHGLWQKMMPYEEGLRVPLLMRYPKRIKPGVRSNVVSSLIDLPATILSIANETIPDNYAGRDLSAAFTDGAEFQDDAYRFSEHQPLGEWHQAVDFRLVVDNHFKYVWNNDDLDELYDLESDPFELNNLVNAPNLAGDLARLQNRLQRWMSETDDPLLPRFKNRIGVALGERK
jgi:arylsulfatase A-like enzyme